MNLYDLYLIRPRSPLGPPFRQEETVLKHVKTSAILAPRKPSVWHVGSVLQEDVKEPEFPRNR